MGQVIELRNGALKHIIFYEISEPNNIAVWGGESAIEALKWYRNSPSGSKIWVSEWITDDEDAKRMSEQIEITDIVLATIADCMERWAK